MDALGRTCSALGIADDPAHGIAGSDRPGADELLAFLQGNVRHLPRRGINLIERARRERIDLHRVDVTITGRLDAGRGIGFFDAFAGVAGLRLRTRAMQRLELAGKRQQLW